MMGRCICVKVLMPAPGPHFLIWSCAKKLRITPSIGRSTVRWAANKTKILLTVRTGPFWDTGFVESAMPVRRKDKHTHCQFTAAFLTYPPAY
jgi:hypothetical protein